MNLLRTPEGDVLTIDAPDWTGAGSLLKIGVTKASIAARANRGMSWYLGQLYGVVMPGLIMTNHVFRGLRRDMLVAGDSQAAAQKIAATWTAKQDAQLVGDRSNPSLETCAAPPHCVFVVYISVNRMVTEFPAIYGWAEHWAWLAADPELDGAPIDWQTRYDEKVWSAHAEAGP